MIKSDFTFRTYYSRLFFLFFFFTLLSSSFAQNNSVAIGSTEVREDAVLWLVPNGQQGLVLPVTTRSGFTPSEEGMLIYDSSDKKIYYWNATTWIEVGGGGGAGGTTYGLTYDASTGDIILVEGGAGLSISPTLSGDISGPLNATQIEAGAVGVTALSSMGATNGQILEWDSGLNQWKPVDNSGGGGTDDQTIDQLSLNGTDLELSLEDDGEAVQTVDLSSLQDGVNDADSDPANEAITDFSLAGTTLSISENSIVVGTVDLSPVIPPGGTDDQMINQFSLSGTNLELSLEDDGQAVQTVDLSSLAGTDSQDLSTADGGTTASVDISGGGGITLTEGTNISLSATGGNNITISTAAAAALPNTGNREILIGDGGSVNAVTTDGDVEIANDGTTTITNVATTGNNIVSAINTGAGTIDAARLTLPSDHLIDTDIPNVAGDISGDFNSGLTIDNNTITSTKIQDNAVTALKIVDDAVTSAKIDDGAIVDADINNFAAINPNKLDIATANPGEILQIDGGGNAVWSAAGGSNDAESLQGTAIDPSLNVPADGSVLKWVNANGQWEAQPDLQGSGATLPSLTDAQIVTSTGVDTPVGVSMSGAITMNNTGATVLQPNVVTIAEIGTAGLGDADKVLTTDGSGDPQWELKSAIGGVGDMTAAIYDPTNVTADVFDRANHAGTQTATTISDFNTAADARITAASVTDLSDVTSVGSGDIITGLERTQIGTNTTNITANATSIGGKQDDVVTTLGDMIVRDGSGAARLPVGTNGQVLQVAAGIPAWTSGSGWGLSGNAGTNDATDFIGTTDGQDLVFRQNGTQAGRVHEASFNNSFGKDALTVVTTGLSNTAMGSSALGALTTGVDNSAMGSFSLSALIGGGQNTAIGFQALRNMTGADNNTAIGWSALVGNQADDNIGIGVNAGSSNTTGSSNIYIGNGTGAANTSGDAIVLIGTGTDVGADGLNNATAIGAGASVSTNNTVRLGRDSDAIEFAGQLLPAGPGSVGTLDQVLTSDAAGLASWQTSTASPWNVNGSDVNYLTGNVGIGVAVPTETLDIRGATAADATSMQLSNSDESHRMVMFSGNSGDPNPFIGVEGSDPLRFVNFDAGFTELARFDEQGRFGIGTPLPLSKFQVTVGDMQLDEGYSLLAIDPTAVFSYLSTAEVPHYGVGWYSDSETPGLAQGYLSGFAGIKMFTNGLRRMSVSQNGNVSIGTLNPAINAILDLQSTTQGLLMPRLTTTERNAIPGPETGLMIFNSTTNGFNYYDGGSWSGFAGGVSDLQSAYDGGSSSINLAAAGNLEILDNAGANSIFYIDEAVGNVGIGTTTPNTTNPFTGKILHISGIDNTGIILEKTDGITNKWGVITGGSGEFIVQNDRDGAQDNAFVMEKDVVGDQLYLRAGGNVGIGTASPTTNLEVSGTGTVISRTSSTSGDVAIDLFRTGAGNIDYRFFSDSSDDTFRLQSSGNDLTSSIDVMTVNGTITTFSGAVGMGGTPGPYALAVSGESNFRDAMYMDSDEGAVGDILVSQALGGEPNWISPATLGLVTGANNGLTSSSGTVGLGGALTGDTEIDLESSIFSFTNPNNYSEPLLILDGTGDGNVGIGFNSPADFIDGGFTERNLVISSVDADPTNSLSSMVLHASINNANQPVGRINFIQRLGVTDFEGARIESRVVNNQDEGLLAFYTGSPGAGLEEEMILDEDGNLTLINGQYLGDGSALSGISGDNFGDHTATQNIILGTTNHLSGDGGNEGIRIDASGNTSIGTTPSTASRLNVSTSSSTGTAGTFTNNVGGQSGSALEVVNQGTRSVGNNGMLVQNLVTKSGGSGTTKIGLKVESTGSWSPGTGQDNVGLDVTVSGADDNYAALFNGGNVGIGTTSPSRLLDVRDNSTGFAAFVQQGNSAGNGLDVYANVSSSTQNIFRVTNNTTGFYVKGNGNVGIGTSSPVNDLDVVGGVAVGASYSGNDVAPTNGAIFEGQVGIGTSSPLNIAQAEIETSVYSFGLLIDQQKTTGTTYGLRVFQGNSTGTEYGVHCSGEEMNYFSSRLGIGITSPSVELDISGSIEYTGSITDVSDRRLKENIEELNSVLPHLLDLAPYTYNMIDDSLKIREYGLMAQDVQKYFPETVKVVDPVNGYLGLSYVQLIPVTIKAIQEQQEIIENQDDKITELEKRIASLEVENTSLKKADLNENQLKAMKAEIMKEVKAMLGAEAKKTEK